MAALLAFVMQLVAMFAPLGDDLPRRMLFIGSYLLLFSFAALNLRRPGVVILGIGLVLNFLPIAANGGLMPITPETLERSGDVPDDVEVGEWIPDSKDVLLERDDVRLYFLSDRIVSDDLSPFRAFSIGDVVIIGGMVVLIAELLMPRLGRVNGTV